jgi:hypothetical protein
MQLVASVVRGMAVNRSSVTAQCIRRILIMGVVRIIIIIIIIIIIKEIGVKLYDKHRYDHVPNPVEKKS